MKPYETTEHKLYMRWKQVGATLQELRDRPDTDSIALNLLVEAEAKLALAFGRVRDGTKRKVANRR